MERERVWGSGNSDSNLSSMEERLEGYALLWVGLAFTPQTFLSTCHWWWCHSRLPSLRPQHLWHPWAVLGGWLVTSEWLGIETIVCRGAFVLCLCFLAPHSTPWLCYETSDFPASWARWALPEGQHFQTSLKQQKQKKSKNNLCGYEPPGKVLEAKPPFPILAWLPELCFSLSPSPGSTFKSHP